MPAIATEKLLLSADEADALLGIGRTHFWGLHSSGRLPLPVRLGRRTLWCAEELRSWTQNRLPNGELMNRERWILFKEKQE